MNDEVVKRNLYALSNALKDQRETISTLQVEINNLRTQISILVNDNNALKNQMNVILANRVIGPTSGY